MDDQSCSRDSEKRQSAAAPQTQVGSRYLQMSSECVSLDSSQTSMSSHQDYFGSTAEEFSAAVAKIDELLDEYSDEPYEIMNEAAPSISDAKWVEFSHRFAQACYIRYNKWHGKRDDDAAMAFVKKGLAAVEKAFAMDSSHIEVLTQCAVLSGTLAENSPKREQARLGSQFKSYLDKAIALAPNDFALLHMRGRFLVQLSELSWIERKAAAVFFHKLPEASYDLALADLLKAYETVPDAVDNLLFIGKAFLGKNDKASARIYLEKVTKIEAIDACDEDQIDQARELLATI